MIGSVFHTIIYLPIYNALVYFVDIIPTHDIGLAVIIVTILVRLILFPIARKAIRSQIAMKAVAPEIEEIKQKYKDKPDEQGKAMFALYKERGVNPFSGFLLLFLQIPVLLGLYWVFAKGGFPVVKPELLYPFVHVPPVVNMEFLGFLSMTSHSIVLALLVALTQATYTRLSMGPVGTVTQTEASFSDEMAKSFDIQARYVLPVIIGGVSYFVAAAAPLYWVTGNIFMICQELFIGRRFHGNHKISL